DIESLNGREIVFRIGIKDKDIVKYKNGQNIKIDFISKQYLYSTKVCIIEKRLDEYSTYYKANIISPIEKNQRRNHYRLSINENVSYAMLSNELKLYNGTAKDISVGGMLIESTNYIHKNKKIKIFFELDKKRYNVIGMVINTRENNFEDMYLHHIKFDGLSRKEKSEITRYVFNEQKKNIRRGTGTL
ncbi:MAG: flagellar brake protein, partial [Peptostreptococcaceae bacterium]